MTRRAWSLTVLLVTTAVVYGFFGPTAAAEPDDDTDAVKALREEIAALRASLDKQKAAGAALRARVDALEGRDSLHVKELTVGGVKSQPALRLAAATHGGGRVEVFAKTGKRVALLFARRDNDGELALYDEQARLRANLGGNDTGGYANFYRETGDQAAYIGADVGKPYGYVAVYGGEDQEIVGLYGNPKGGVVSCRNLATKKQIVMMGAEPKSGMGFVGLGTSDGKPALASFVTKNGGQIKVLNADNKEAAFLGASANPAGHGLLYLCRKDGTRTFEGGCASGGGGYVSMHNKLNKRVLFFGASSGNAPDDGVVEVADKNSKLGVVLRAYAGRSSVRVYDAQGNVKNSLR